MSRHKGDQRYAFVSIDEQRLARHLANAFAFERTRTDQGVRIVFAHERAMQEFFDCIVRMGDAGHVTGATVFTDQVREKDPGREVRAALLTRFARVFYDTEYGADRRPIRESEVAHAGRFVNAVVAEMPQTHLEWAEDMGDGCPECGLEPQPTAVIRGVFLSPALDQRKAAEFWKLAAASKRFPLRIFSDPCGSEEGAIFSSWHMRAFALVFTNAPEAAVERFAAHMREHAVAKMLKVFVSAKWVDKPAPATATDRKNVFDAISSNIEIAARRTFARGLFGLDS